MIIAVRTLDRCKTGTKSAHSLRFSPLPFHDPVGGWMKAGGGCRAVVRFDAEAADRHPSQRTEP